MPVFRIYVEKQSSYAVEAKNLLNDIKLIHPIALDNIRIINRYDVEGISVASFKKSQNIVFCEPTIDTIYFNMPKINSTEHIIATEYLPGQFDQRADSCAESIQLLVGGDKPSVKNARIYIVSGQLSAEDIEKLKNYLINPVDSREASLKEVDTLTSIVEKPSAIPVISNFINMDNTALNALILEYSLAMDIDDITFCKEYFKNEEKRNPTVTEIKMLDTYWSDHCRHTTFLTNIDNITIVDPIIQATYDEYLQVRESLGRGDKPITLMDMALIAARKLKADGDLPDLDESEEINACSVKISVDIDGKIEPYLLMFKNETHNHPTEIEPFGGAATCLGGAIRDPLSGRAYVYSAMRVTGAADPLTPIEETLKSKLPQRKIVTGAASGYSSYGNQIGLATGIVSEIYHPGYVAKRMEVGAVIAAAPTKNVRRERPNKGDIIVLLGGKTGRDGCGGATGSSKAHTVQSVDTCGAEVQKGNPPEERKIQRLFRNPNVTKLIKRCNDFGAGGVSVAIGELADGLIINLDAVPKKYDGLSGTELAISESQERMACVIEAKDVDKFLALSDEENLEATVVATVTDTNRLVMNFCNEKIVDLSREFINSNGATKHTNIELHTSKLKPLFCRKNKEFDWIAHLSSLNIASQRGLIERFDSSIGAGSVLLPLGGDFQLTPTVAMVSKIPVLNGTTETCSVMSYGFNPYISEQSPYYGAMYAVIESVAKVIAVGGSYKKCWLTFQEYFAKPTTDTRFGDPAAALLGAFKAQLELKIAAIGGKDSMSGTFEDITVPPTLISFAVSLTTAQKAISQEIKEIGSPIALVMPKYDVGEMPDFSSVKATFDKVEQLIADGYVNACYAIGFGGISEAIAKMCMGNGIGVKLNYAIDEKILFNPTYGGFVIELSKKAKNTDDLEIIGITTSKYIIAINESNFVDMPHLQASYEKVLEPVYKSNIKHTLKSPITITYDENFAKISSSIKFAKPTVLIPVFPGTNCEYDTAKAFDLAGAKTDIFVIKNRCASQIEQSVQELSMRISNAQIVMLPGGFSGGDEPDGSAKFIAAFLRNSSISEAISRLLETRDGLMLGICNGFQALVKLGLLPYGKICELDDTAPTLTYNTIGRHQAMMVSTRISSVKSPWLYNTRIGDIHTVPISHGEGRFVCTKPMLKQLADNGQIATQYVDLQGNPSYDVRFNPNESYMGIEGITSQDGRIFGKMAHSERIGANIHKNVGGDKDQMIFRSGVEYFK